MSLQNDLDEMVKMAHLIKSGPLNTHVFNILSDQREGIKHFHSGQGMMVVLEESSCAMIQVVS